MQESSLLSTMKVGTHYFTSRIDRVVSQNLIIYYICIDKFIDIIYDTCVIKDIYCFFFKYFTF